MRRPLIANVDATGHVTAGSVRVVESRNPGLDREAERIVAARRGGHDPTADYVRAVLRG